MGTSASTEEFSDAGPFDESFTAWGAEDNEFGYRVMNAGYYFIPVLDALGLHQEPPGGREFVDREAGKLITRPMLLDMVPTYRDYDPDVQSTTSMVSIYIPAYNAKKTIDRAIQSALDQTYRDFDIVICNDGSTDGTGEHLDLMYGDHPKIQIIHQSNGGIGAASNACIRAARGCTFSNLTAMTNCFRMPSLLCCRKYEEIRKSVASTVDTTSGIRKRFVGRSMALPEFH